MKSVIILIWNSGIHLGNIFGVYTSKDEMEKAIAATAENIKMTAEDLKGDLYVHYGVGVNKLGQAL